MMTKHDTIDAIRSFNPTANPAFLAEFSNDQLARYLDRLTSLSKAHPFDHSGYLVELDEPLSIEPHELSIHAGAATKCESAVS